ncbi:DUF2062 domain-containing protein [Pontibacter liquoris]|uniref:DUF2062 domain-containing protein n=1 Tax=Pontibacter liquoris TaxID=2905677 RepID=UPI001FA730EB|nr:DUF2062 domain-containing protein [Pontibacter liquoris]
MRSYFIPFLKRRLVAPILNLLKQGMTPHKLAVTVALGTVVGVVPALGVTTVLGTALAARFRLNIAATVLVSYLVQPLQLLLALPFIRAGIYMFGLAELRLTFDEITAMFKADWLAALEQLWLANLAGISAWALLALPAGGVLYLVLLPVFKLVLPVPKPAVVAS